MKANDAPEKIYIPTILAANTVRYKEEGSIEYIRTDAFIEKASGWIEENIKKWYENIKVHGFKGMTPLMIIEFRKYMKGE